LNGVLKRCGLPLFGAAIHYLKQFNLQKLYCLKDSEFSSGVGHFSMTAPKKRLTITNASRMFGMIQFKKLMAQLP